MIRNRNFYVPSDIVQILFVFVTDDPRRHDPAVVKRPGPSEWKYRLVVNVEHLLTPLCIDFDIRRLRASISVSCAKVDTQDAAANSVDDRKRSVRSHPVKVMIRRKDDAFLYPLHVRI